MSRQEPIYIKNENSAIRNKDMFNISMSSDLCVFNKPMYDMSGTTKIPCNDLTCDFSGVSYTDILSASTGTCNTVIVSATCISDITWSINVSEDSSIVFSGDFYTQTSITGVTPTNIDFIPVLSGGFETLGYSYTNTDDSFTITKPYGTTQLDVDICLTYNQIDGCYSGACSADCTNVCSEIYDSISSTDTGVYILSANTGNINVVFDFTGNTLSFIDNETIFKYEIYKYNKSGGVFQTTPVYQSGNIEWSSFSATSAITESIPVNRLSIDGDYLVKGFFNHQICTEFFSYLDQRIDTSLNKGGDDFGLYNSVYDYFFIAIKEADNPILGSASDYNGISTLSVNSFIASSGDTFFNLTVTNSESFILSLNGLVLANYHDYTFTALTSSNVLVELNAPTVTDDVITYATIGNGVNDTVKYDIYDITTPIVSGVTNGEGSESVYYNTETGKYELFTTLTPANNTDLSLTLNGVVLAHNIDYYQSTSNAKRIILEGNLNVNDILILFYPANPSVFGNLFSANATINWSIPITPLNNEGLFTLEASTNSNMDSIVYSATTPYVTNQTTYSIDALFSGGVGTTLYYRVKNEKKYESICGDIIISDAFSEIVPITIQTNSFNSY